MSSNCFIVLAHPRTGTTYFCNDILSSHEEVFCFDELFNQKGHIPTLTRLENMKLQPFDSLKYKAYSFLTNEKKAHLGYIKDFKNRSQEIYNKPIIGFKLFPFQIPNDVLDYLIENTSIKFIVLRRKNIIQAAVSMFLLQFYKRRNSNDKKEFEEYEIDINWCKNFIERYNNSLNNSEVKLKKTPDRFLKIYYEELFEIDTINECYSFLNTKPIKVIPSGSEKLNSGKIYKKIKNLNQIQFELCNVENGYLFET